MRELVEELDDALFRASNDRFRYGPKSEMVDRIKREEEFRRTEFQTHLKSDSGIGAHCQRMLLGASVDSRFQSPCTHDGGCVPPLEPMRPELMGPSRCESMVEFHRRVSHLQPLPTDWNDACKVTHFFNCKYH